MWYLSSHPQAEATTHIRRSIRRYNKACGVITTDTSGYHETITLFFIRVVRQYLDSSKTNHSLVELTNEFIAQYGDRNLPLLSYRKERLRSREAGSGWVEPDLKPLD